MHQLCDAGPLDVVLEVAEAVVGVRIDRVNGYRFARLRAETETNGRLSFPRADLDDDAVAATCTRKLVQRFAFLVRQPAGNVRDQRFDVSLEGLSQRRTRRDGATTRLSRCVPAALGRATGTSPRARRGRARTQSTCGRRPRPRAQTRSYPEPRAETSLRQCRP